MSESRSRVGGRPRLGVLLYLLALAAVVALVVLPPARGAWTGPVESIFAAREEGWIRRVEEGEALLAAGEHEAAAAHFAELDGRFPARVNTHSLDKERERILVGLGRAYESTGRKGRSLAALRRAVAFDPLNVENHYALAAAAIRLGEEGEGDLHLAHILETYPGHERAARDRIALQFEAGDFAAVRRTFEEYAGAFRVKEIVVSAGEMSIPITIPEDGRPHELRVPLPRQLSTPSVVLRTETGSVLVDGVEWVGRPIAGLDGRVVGEAPALGETEYGLPTDPPAELRVLARALIPISEEANRQVAAAYRNLLASDAFDSYIPRLSVYEVVP